MDQERKVYSYRNWHEATISVAFIGAILLSILLTSNAVLGVPAMHPHLLKAIEFAFVGPCLWGFSAFLFYASLRFWNEKVEINGVSITWHGRWGRIRCQTRATEIRSIEETFVMTAKGWIVKTDQGPIRFDCRINCHRNLNERFQEFALRS